MTSNAAGKRAPPPQLIFDDGSRIMAEASNAATGSAKSLANPSTIRGLMAPDVYYEIDRIAKEIVAKFFGNAETQQSNQLLRVALQFPDELLDDSPEVCWMLEEQLNDRTP